MPQRLQIETDFTTDEIRRLARSESDPRVRQRLLGIYHVRAGRSVSQAAKAIALAESKLRKWVHRFNAEGVEGLKDRPRPGRPAKLTEQQKASFKTRIEAGPTESDGIVRFRWQEMQRILREEYGADYKAPWCVLKLVHTLGISWLSCRPIHPKSDPAKQEEFKKNAL